MKLIDKSALVAEINKLKKSHDIWSYMGKRFHQDYETLLSFIDTLEVKEVDLEEETKKWWKERLHLNPENQLWMDAHQSIVFAKHFFELGLKVNKSLTWEDIANINEIVSEILKECGENILYNTQEDFCKEVLKRFKAMKEK